MMNDLNRQNLLEDTQKNYDYIASVKDDCIRARTELCRLIDVFLQSRNEDDINYAYSFAFSDNIASLYSLDPDSCRYKSIIDILYSEKSMGFTLFSEGLCNYREVLCKYCKCNFMLRRIMFFKETEYETEAVEYLIKENISPIAISIILGEELFVNRSDICRRLGDKYKEAGHAYADMFNVMSVSFEEDNSNARLNNDLSVFVPEKRNSDYKYKTVEFLILSNDDLLLDEVKLYLSRLLIPNGVQVGIQVITDATSMLSGMRRLRDMSSADIKIYIHNDTFILNRNIVGDIISIFESDPLIGMIGMFGTKSVPANGIMWQGDTVGQVFDMYDNETGYSDYKYSVYNDGYSFVNAVDGLFMATNRNVEFREDLFDGWDLYDLSTCFEYLKKGYKIVVPNQKKSWCYHSEGNLVSPWNYDKYRKIAMEQYKEYLC